MLGDEMQKRERQVDDLRVESAEREGSGVGDPVVRSRRQVALIQRFCSALTKSPGAISNS